MRTMGGKRIDLLSLSSKLYHLSNLSPYGVPSIFSLVHAHLPIIISRITHVYSRSVRVSFCPYNLTRGTCLRFCVFRAAKNACSHIRTP